MPHSPVESSARVAPASGHLVTPERSVFGTRLPRPTGVGRHLTVVILMALIALAVAIGFAERSPDAEAAAGSTERFTRPPSRTNATPDSAPTP